MSQPSIGRVTEMLKVCDRVRELSDDGYSEADRLVYFYDIARDHVVEASGLFDRLFHGDISSEEACEIATKIEDVMSRLFSDMQYPRSYRWFIRHDLEDLE
jgi:hypothetical protein